MRLSRKAVGVPEDEYARLRARVEELAVEAQKNFDWAKAERSGRKQERTRADAAEARVKELEQDRDRAWAELTRLEKRKVVARVKELERHLEVAQNDLRIEINERNGAEARVKELENAWDKGAELDQAYLARIAELEEALRFYAIEGNNDKGRTARGALAHEEETR